MQTKKNNILSASQFYIFATRLTVWSSRLNVCVCLRTPSGKLLKHVLLGFRFLPAAWSGTCHRSRRSTARDVPSDWHKTVFMRYPFFLAIRVLCVCGLAIKKIYTWGKSLCKERSERERERQWLSQDNDTFYGDVSRIFNTSLMLMISVVNCGIGGVDLYTRVVAKSYGRKF